MTGVRPLLGVNLPYFRGAYGHDLAPSPRFPDWPVESAAFHRSRPLLEARALGLEAVRIWLCEGAEGIVVDARGRPTGVHPSLLESIRIIDEAALVAGVRVSWTILDAGSVSRDEDAITGAILGDADAGAAFAEHVVRPIARALDPRVAVALEIVNEPEIVSPSCADARPPGSPSIAWDALGRTIAIARDAARAERSELLVTAGTGKVFLRELWQSGARLDAIDVHVYDADGGLPSREDLARDVGDRAILDPSLPLLAGECGIPEGADGAALTHYLWNAVRHGYAAAFLWKLEGELVDERAPGRPTTPLGNAVKDHSERARA